MLRTPAGATIASLVTVTEWQQHSVRGFLAGVIRKKLGLNLVSEQTDKGRRKSPSWVKRVILTMYRLLPVYQKVPIAEVQVAGTASGCL